MKRVRTEIDDEYQYYFIEEFIFRQCDNMYLSIFLRIQLEKGLITFNELLEICQIDNKEDFDLVDW